MVEPNHPPFNRWLLSGEPLSPEQNAILQDHLRGCAECRHLQVAWSEVEFHLHSAGQVAPALGFTSRWQQRLTWERLKRQRRYAWILFLGAGGMALVILTLIGWQIAGVFNSPASILSGLVYLWTFGLVQSERMVDFFWISARYLPSITIIGLMFLIGFCTLMSVLWLVTYRQLTNKRRFTAW